MINSRRSRHWLRIFFTLTLALPGIISSAQTYTMPHENDVHEGTWLQWPHQYEYGLAYRNRLDATWVAMTAALVPHEKVHIIAYNTTEKNRIITLLTTAAVPQTNITWLIATTNDCWVRDNGPIFVRDNLGAMKIEDWGFNGWGGDYNFNLCNPIPTTVATSISMPLVNLNTVMTNEGGAVELDGNGVLLACKSSVISQSPANSVRNPGITQVQAEANFTQYLGVTKFVWLNGVTGIADDVTDFHIDGFAKFVDDSVLVTMNNANLTYWGASSADIATLYAASNVSNVVYTKVYLPLSQNNVVTTYGTNLGFKGSYVNYYVANGVVLVPTYSDPNDATAITILQGLYPGRTVTGIDCRNLYANGGMVHCVTQQQPLDCTLGAACDDGDANTVDTYTAGCVCTGQYVRVSAKVLLSGPLPSGASVMNDNLRTLATFPLTEPYSALGLAPSGGSTTIASSVLAVTGNNAIEDWILLELRSAIDPHTVLVRRSALVQRDGDVVDVDGVSALKLPAAPGNYYVAVRHRNHFGVMSATAIALTSTAVTIDFRATGTPTYGMAAQNVNGSVMALWQGDVLRDGTIKYTGAGNDRDPILAAIGGIIPTNTLTGQYRNEDVNMDGVVKYTGASNDRDLVLLAVGGIVPTNTRAEQLP